MNIFAELGAVYLNCKGTHVKEIFELCGGRIAKIWTESTMIIGEKRPEFESHVRVSANWVVDSVFNAQAMPIAKYTR